MQSCTGCSLPLGEGFDGDDLAAGDIGKERDAAVERAPGRLPIGASFDDCDGAGPAVPFRASLLAPRVAVRAKVLEERGRGGKTSTFSSRPLMVIVKPGISMRILFFRPGSEQDRLPVESGTLTGSEKMIYTKYS